MTAAEPHAFDVFVSYSHADAAWVRDWLLPRLEAEDLRVCIDVRDFDAGVPVLVNIERAAANSRHTLLVLTPRWVDSQWTDFESLLVQHQNPNNFEQWLVPVLRERCQPPARIAMLSYADLSEHADVETEWTKLLDALRGVRRLPDSPAPKRLASLVQPRDQLHQLPAPVPDFVGRAEEIAALVRGLGRAIGGAAAISGIRGLGGIGKTQLAYVVAQQLAPTFPDAQLLLDLRGASTSPLAATQALQQVIRAFEPLAQLPDDQGELERLYRSLLSGKRVLVLADDAASAAQVRPLLPPSGSALLVTSRQRFGLDGMLVRDLGILSPEEAEHLLLEICSRIGEHAAELARLCGRLPLALRLSASLIENDALSVPRYLEQLKAERLKHLIDPDDPARDVEASLQLSYNALEADAQQVLAQLSVFPASFDRAAAEAIVRLPGHDEPAPDALEPLLRLLYRRSLLERNPESERSSLHDLVRAFAAARLPDADAVALRHAQHYAAVAEQADQLYLQGGDNLMSGLALFDGERQQIDAGWQWARSKADADLSIDELLVKYADATVYVGALRYDNRRERIPQLEAALTAAKLLERQAAQRSFLGNLGIAYRNLGQPQRAIKYHEQQLEIARRMADQRGEGVALGNLGSAYMMLGELRWAIEYYQQRLNIARAIGDRRGEGAALGNLGGAYYSLGDVQRSIQCYEESLVIARAIGDRRGEGNVLGNLAIASAEADYPHQALDYFEQGLEIARTLGDRRGEGHALGNLGNVYATLGESRRAIEYYEQRLEIAQAVGDQRGQALTSWNMGKIFEQQCELGRAIDLMQIRVDYEREIGHADAEKDVAYVEQLRQRLAQGHAGERKRKPKRKRKKK